MVTRDGGALAEATGTGARIGSGPEVPTRCVWEHFAHGADIGVRGRGKTMAEAFGSTAMALSAVVCDLSSIRTVRTTHVVSRAPTPELLLVDWLNAIIYVMATERMLFAEFRVDLTGTVLRGELRGEPIDRARHQPAVEVKGATHTALRVEREPDGRWTAQCVIDV